jgi:lariat debranching enzyme
VRNASDLTVMSCPVKFREIGDFHHYYSGEKKAPYLTIFIGGNHEASSHLWELFYGGWAAPNIFYMGAANVVRLGGVRIAGMSGIWKGYNFRKPHHERLPYSQDDIRSFYHIREYDVRKLLQLRTQVDIGISHDWPTAIEKLGNERELYRMKPDFEQESRDGSLGSKPAAWVMDRLRPPYWFAAHMHCRFAAVKTFEDAPIIAGPKCASPSSKACITENSSVPGESIVTRNEDEIDLDVDEDDEDEDEAGVLLKPNGVPAPENHDKLFLDKDNVAFEPESSVSSDLRAQLPAAFARPVIPSSHTQAGQPVPPGITNKTVRFLALDKCLPGRKFLQLLEIAPHSISEESTHLLSEANPRLKPKFEYDPEWLAITRVFAPDLVLGNKFATLPHDLGEAQYLSLIQKEEAWVEENIVKKGMLTIPENFELTAPPFIVGSPEIVSEGPVEYSNPQMQQFCDLVGIENKFFATDEERKDRMKNGPPPTEERRDGGFGGQGRGRGRGGDRGRGGRGRGRGGRGGGGRGGRRW